MSEKANTTPNTKKLPTQPYRGTRDFLPEEMSVRTQIFQCLYRTAETFGFQRYDGPTMEPAAIYEAKSGEEIANLQLYRLKDRADRELALRPEMTPTVARMIAANASQLSMPARWYSHPNCFRYERPQRGRVREHWQLNVDIFGSESLEAEVEIFELVSAIMKSLGATPEMYVLRVNDRILVEAALANYVGVPLEHQAKVTLAVDGWEKTGEEHRLAELKAAGLSEDQIQRLNDLVRMDLHDYSKAAGHEAAQRSRLTKILKDGLADAPLQYDPMIIRAFNYYTSTVFEVFDTSPDNNRSIFGGGRYDDLASLFTSDRISGIGFGMGDVTTWNFLEAHGLLPKPKIAPTVYAWTTAAEHRNALRSVCRSLRQRSISTVPAFEPLSFKNGLSKASKLGARFAIVLAPQEMERGVGIVKNLVQATQSEVALDEIPSYVEAASKAG